MKVGDTPSAKVGDTPSAFTGWAKLSTGSELVAPILPPFDLGRITVEGQRRAVCTLNLVHAVFGQGVAGDSLAQVPGKLAVGLGRSAPSVQIPKGEYPPGLLADMAASEAVQKPIKAAR